MNRAASSSLKDSTFDCGHFRNPKKRRHRNKFRNSSFRKNRQKKLWSQKKDNSKLNSFKFNPDTVSIMSNWYWSNYKKAAEWQDRHKLAHWKACALALMEENRYLLQIINTMQPGMIPEVPTTQSSLYEGIKCNENGLIENPFENFINVRTPGPGIYNDETDEEEGEGDECNEFNDQEDADDDEFEMSEEMIQFFEQSYKRKMDLKKLKEKELLNKAEEEIKQMQTNIIKKSTEMNLLYGEGASMIIGMETAVQLSFDKYCDTKSPKYWPNIPFRL